MWAKRVSSPKIILANAIDGFVEFGIRPAHRRVNGARHFRHEWLVRTEQSSVTNAAAQNLSQDVAAAFIGRNHAVGNQKCRGARVVGNDAQGSVTSRRMRPGACRSVRRRAAMSGTNKSVSKLLIFPCNTAARRSRPAPVSIDGFGSGVDRARSVTIELHEDQVPDFDVASAVAAEFAVRMALIGRGWTHV